MIWKCAIKSIILTFYCYKIITYLLFSRLVMEFALMLIAGFVCAGLIRLVSKHSSQLIYTRTTKPADGE